MEVALLPTIAKIQRISVYLGFSTKNMKSSALVMARLPSHGGNRFACMCKEPHTQMAKGWFVRNRDISHQRSERPVFRIAAIGALRRE